MRWENPSNDRLKQVLTTAKTIAVVGLSSNPDRTSYQIAQIMQKQGYRIIPVNPTISEVLGEKSYPSLTDVEEQIDIINVFRRPEHLLDIAKEAVQTNCSVFWAQQGISNEDAYDYLKKHDFTVIMDLCIKVVHAVLVK
ncbi:MAG: CoA-binding protein [Bacillota bacterium]|uniref:CoA-binding protein n=1 Tax=Virgibacillus salarius TaxID=447199 RepID=A0A941I8Y7_9BACI|nr:MULTISPECIES: CoA-binding protein [Bacillaceae]NAZ08867.1 CoA-binding protein [Agaribacter marinus]MBR7796159.1 CoA-binding protein [Virgibacillus salarius]MCC2249671.1 CoA-binding protein [Virgibacillus sp. AGTR]MDY7042662.1 CoA-binding protein [Virgibacillus sp. M23]QRZ17117.1 CoA-binding protein [Virgibacillus sp. AGTR]